MKSGVPRPPESFELEISLAVCVSLCLHVHFKIFFLFVKMILEFWWGNILNLKIFMATKPFSYLFLLSARMGAVLSSSVFLNLFLECFKVLIVGVLLLLG